MEHLLTFSDLADSPEFEEFYTTLWKLLHIPLALGHPDDIRDSTIGRGKRFSPKKEFSPICRVIRSSPKGEQKCLDLDAAKLKEAVESHKSLCYQCHAGLTDFAIPIYVGKNHIATIHCGQIMTEVPTEEGFNKLWTQVCDLDISKPALREAYFEATYMAPEKVESVLKLLTFFADYFCQVGVRVRLLEGQNKHPEVGKAIKYINDHFTEPMAISDVAEHVGFSRAHFSRIFKRVQGVSLTEYLQQLRLLEVKRLLEESNASISTIAFGCGFSSLQYFNMFFRKMTGMAPTQYRKNAHLHNSHS